MNDNAKIQLEELKDKVNHLSSILSSLKRTVEKFESEFSKPDYSQIDGLVGKYDGKFMIMENGEKLEVPQNYAAKSKLVYGDVLKQIEENGRKIFKHIEKVERLRVDGILTKKEGEWYVLTDRGSYKVSDVAADFQKAQLNSEASVLLPVKNLDAPFATLDTVVGFEPGIKKAEDTPSQDNEKTPSSQVNTNLDSGKISPKMNKENSRSGLPKNDHKNKKTTIDNKKVLNKQPNQGMKIPNNSTAATSQVITKDNNVPNKQDKGSVKPSTLGKQPNSAKKLDIKDKAPNLPQQPKKQPSQFSGTPSGQIDQKPPKPADYVLSDDDLI